MTGVYLSIFYERQGELIVRVDSLSRVFDVHQPVGGLDITYAGENLRGSKRTLWVLNVSVQNRGNAAVKKGDFDEAVPLGFSAAGAVEAEQPRLTSATAYLRQNVRATAKGGQVTLTPAVFEPGDSVEMTLLLLGSEASKPQIVPSGKIAGQRAIEVVELQEEVGTNPDFFDRQLPGKSMLTKILRGGVRVISWFFIFILGIAAVAWPIIGLALLFDKVARMRRRREVNRLVQGQQLSDLRSKVFDVYVQEGANGLRIVLRSVALAAEYLKDYLPHLSNFPDDEAREKFLKKYEPRQLRFRDFAKRFKIEGWLNGLEDIEQLESETLGVAAKVNLDAASLRADLELARSSSIW